MRTYSLRFSGIVARAGASKGPGKCKGIAAENLRSFEFTLETLLAADMNRYN